MNEKVNAIMRVNGMGGLSDSLTSLLAGIDHTGMGGLASPNRDDKGLVFFTKPKLNLSYDNVQGIRSLTALRDAHGQSMPAAIVAMLDPDGAKGTITAIDTESKPGEATAVRRGNTSIVDPQGAFIDLLGNACLSLSGFPDYTIDLYTSQAGNGNETFTHVDSFPKDYGNYSLTANFQNVEGDPVGLLANVWLEYAARVSEGSMLPYPDMIIENEIDYQTRIYRLILDPSRTIVQRICAANVCIPTASPTGAAFNYDKTAERSGELNQVSIPFSCTGFEFNDPILIEEFNRTVQYFNPSMMDDESAPGVPIYIKQGADGIDRKPVVARKGAYTKIPQSMKQFCNGRGYPRISSEYELEWWLPTVEYKLIVAEVKKHSNVRF